MDIKTDKRNLGGYELFQLLTYGNILRPTSTKCEDENGAAESEQFAEWMEREAEQQNYEHEQNY